MGTIREVPPEQVVVAAFSRHTHALEKAQSELSQRLGPIALTSLPFRFDQTRYYESSMGADLIKQLWTFERLVPADSLPTLKLLTNDLEREIANDGTCAEERPINLDPGLLGLAKFLLATTKDQAHRIYLRQGIFAEITLQYREGQFHPCPWTYADYQLPLVREFLLRARVDYRERLKKVAPGVATPGLSREEEE